MAHTPVNGPASAQTMLDFGTWRSGFCLECVWTAYQDNGAQDINGKWDGTAYAAWQHTPASECHNGDWNPPKGVPVYFGPRSGSDPAAPMGDVVISWGDGKCVATDGAGAGRIGIMTLKARQNQIRRPFLGWTETILGWPIEYGSTPAPTPDPTPTPEDEDDEMPKNSCVYTQRSSDKRWTYLMFNYGSGLFHEFGSGSSNPLGGSYTNPIAKALDTPAWAKVTEAHYSVLKTSLVPGLRVDMNDADVKALVDALAEIGDDEAAALLAAPDAHDE